MFSSRTITEKLLTYATGRALKYYDMPVVRAIAREAAQDDNRFSSLDRRNREKRSISDENEVFRVPNSRRPANELHHEKTFVAPDVACAAWA
jgi:hypothetical protein